MTPFRGGSRTLLRGQLKNTFLRVNQLWVVLEPPMSMLISNPTQYAQSAILEVPITTTSLLGCLDERSHKATPRYVSIITSMLFSKTCSPRKDCCKFWKTCNCQNLFQYFKRKQYMINLQFNLPAIFRAFHEQHCSLAC